MQKTMRFTKAAATFFGDDPDIASEPSFKDELDSLTDDDRRELAELLAEEVDAEKVVLK